MQTMTEQIDQKYIHVNTASTIWYFSDVAQKPRQSHQLWERTTATQTIKTGRQLHPLPIQQLHSKIKQIDKNYHMHQSDTQNTV